MRTTARAHPYLVGLLALTVLGAVLRFATLDLQSLWNDEGTTASFMRLAHNRLLGVSYHETTPPTYFIGLWLWARVFGTSAVALRFPSALAGTALIPIAYWAGRTFATRRVGLIVAALCAVNPLLVWYSQEVRPYGLLVTFGALSLVVCARAVKRPEPGRLAVWVVVCALTLAVHYLGVFLIAAEAIWLLVAARRQFATVALACWCVGSVGAGLAVFAYRQSKNGGTSWIPTLTPLWHRVGQIPKQFLTGFHVGAGERAATVVAALLVLLAVWLLLRRGDRELKRAGALCAGIGLFALGIPVLMAIGHTDLILTRNLIAAWICIALVVAMGLGASRAGMLGLSAAAALCAISLALVVAVDANPKSQRSDWRGISSKLALPSAQRAVVTADALPGALRYYRPGMQGMPPQGASLNEIDVIRGIGVVNHTCWWGATCYVPTSAEPDLRIPPAFQPAGTYSDPDGGLVLTRYRSAAPQAVSVAQLFPAGRINASIFVDAAPPRR